MRYERIDYVLIGDCYIPDLKLPEEERPIPTTPLIFHAQPGGTFSFMGCFMYQYPKQILTIAQQVQSYIDAGIVITSRADVHNSRIYNRTIHTTPEILDADKVTPSPAHNGLYQILLAMKYLRSSEEEWTSFVAEMETLFRENSSVISLAAMNFPADWKVHLSV